MNNFYLIDKPIWISSFDVIRQLRKKLNVKKIWHTWTLDPLASGCLLIWTWNYTKLIPYLEKDTKEYEFVVNLDWKTDSFDLWTEVNFLDKKDLERFKKDLKIDKIKEVIENNFLWEILQKPPIYSALKVWWKKMCDLARTWKKVEVVPRKITVFNIDILDYVYPKIKLKAKVSAWTYIRSIANDLWELLWTWWYVSFLRRTKIWNLDISQARNISNIKELDLYDLFPKERIISLDEYILSKINNWIKQTAQIWLKEWVIYFVSNNQGVITNIITFKEWRIIPLRKI